MDNIFDILNNKLPKPPSAVQAGKADTPKPLPALSDMPVKDLVGAWKKERTPEYTGELLKRLRPTIDSAFTSYAPGHNDQLAVRAANITLEALETYDPSRGVEPSTHVFHRLKRLSRYAQQRDNIIPQSEAVQAEVKRVQAASAEWTDYKGREPSLQELADVTGLSMRRLESLLDRGTAPTAVSESSTLSEDSRRNMLSNTDLTDDDYFEYVYSSVGPIDQKIMEWSSGRKGKPAISNNDIAARLHISAPAVSQRKGRIQQLMSDVRSLI